MPLQNDVFNIAKGRSKPHSANTAFYSRRIDPETLIVLKYEIVDTQINGAAYIYRSSDGAFFCSNASLKWEEVVPGNNPGYCFSIPNTDIQIDLARPNRNVEGRPDNALNYRFRVGRGITSFPKVMALNTNATTPSELKVGDVLAFYDNVSLSSKNSDCPIDAIVERTPNKESSLVVFRNCKPINIIVRGGQPLGATIEMMRFGESNTHNDLPTKPTTQLSDPGF